VELKTLKNKFFNIFKPGKHIDAAGQEVSFSEDDLKDIAASYNSEVHEAPICCGHPKHDKPAFGWIKQLCYDAGSKMLRAMPAQVNPEFAEMVNSGAFKKISPAFYSPSSPANPNPGHFTLRHIAFLGAQPPAVKGLGSVSFAESDNADVSFELDFAETELAYNDKGIARLFRNLKNFLIGKYSQEEADNIIPEYAIEEISSGAERSLNKAVEAKTEFSEPETEPKTPAEPEENAKNQLADAVQAKEAENARLKAELLKAKADKQAAENRAFCENQVKAGRLLPAMQDSVLAFMDDLSELELEFAEENSTLTAFKALISQLPPSVNFSEVTPPEDDDAAPQTAADIAAKAAEYQNKQAESGKDIRFCEAVRAVCK
jgi:conserved phage-related protein